VTPLRTSTTSNSSASSSPSGSQSSFETSQTKKPVGGINMLGANPQVLQQLNQELNTKSTSSPNSPSVGRTTNLRTSTPQSSQSSAAPQGTATPNPNPATDSAPPVSSQSFASQTQFYSYEQLKNKQDIEGLDPNKLEIYLSDDEFEKVFGASKDQYSKWAVWKQNAKKRQLGLY